MTMRSYSNIDLENAIVTSTTWSEVRVKLKIAQSSRTHNAIKRAAERLDLDISHLKRIYAAPSSKKDLQYFLKEGREVNGTKLRRRLIAEGYKEERCENCDLTEWQNRPIPLQLEHINGVHTDNRLENLAILCPNCHAQTATFGVRNRIFDKKYYFCQCGKEIGKGSKTCNRCRPKESKINWPSDEELAVLVWEFPTSVLSQKLGVSDSAIAKRCKRRNIKKPHRGFWSSKK